MFSHIDTAPSKNRTWKQEMPMSNGIFILPVHILAFFVFANKSLAGASQHAVPHSSRNSNQNQIPIRFPSPSGHAVTQLAWIRIVHNAVLQPDLRWVPKAFKRAKPNWPPILKEEISGHKSEKAYLTKWIQWLWQRKRCTRAANPSSGNRKPRIQPYLATSSAKNKTKGVYRIKGLGLRIQPVSIILWENNLRTWSGSFLWREGITCAEGCAWHGCLLQSIHIAKEG